MDKKVVFNSPEDFRRTAHAVRSQERDQRVRGNDGVPVPVASSHSSAHVRIVGDYNEDAKGWPGVLTYRNLGSASTPEDWIDGEDVYAEEINGKDLENGRRYRCHVYGLKEWENSDLDSENNPVESMFVLVDLGGGAGGGGSSGEECSWLIGLTTSNCLLSTVIAVYGRCSGISTSQSQRLVWNGGESKYKAGDDAVDVPEDDFTYDGPAIGPIRFWLDGVTPRASIDTIEGIKVGCGPGYVDFAFGGALCTGTTTDPCGKNYFVVRFTCSCCTPTEGWVGPGYYCVEDDSANGKGCVRLLVDSCDGTVILSGPHGDLATCKAACCEIAGWGGAGWYCVFNGTDCEALELLDSDKCDDTIVICSGPYASHGLAILGCGVVCCPDGTTLAFSLAGITNTGDGDTSSCVCSLFNRSYSVTLAGGTGDSAHTGGATCDGNTATFANVTCSAGIVDLTFFTGVDPRATYSRSRSGWNCNGVNVFTLTGTGGVPLCTGFPATINVMTTPP